MLSDTYVVVPVYNEASVIRAVLDDLHGTFANVVCVDDGSSDGSADEVLAAGARLVRHPVNLGQGAALHTGLQYALRTSDCRSFVTYDADGQHRVDDALRMLEHLRAVDVDIVFGSRFLDGRTHVPSAKRAVLRTAVAFSNALSGLRLTDTHNGLRVFTREVAGSLQLRMNGMAHASEIIEIVRSRGFKHSELPVEILYTDYAKAKGQSLLNGVNIAFDLAFR